MTAHSPTVGVDSRFCNQGQLSQDTNGKILQDQNKELYIFNLVFKIFEPYASWEK